ncbi:hypothetical protein DMA12_00150 [Amycolatopsis balhimycina DSM 5908]|uniref:GerMN domain-containing protein n=1 Tax=Amycolatopsis balhimycina DSM 5908 TaxID=1081091 RepID=A0A428X5L7_AMYBA|nr:hypothetical protein [Amycolatopsis balhimycina]RSM50618.1 hypothetical protein DMA12_00150 [Amycolatopsis balhimycina DSM 5908]
MRKLLVLAVVLLVSGCGIKPTPVVPAGPAPTLRSPAGNGRGTDVILYFVVDGRVAPVARPADGPVTVEAALTMLLDGPSLGEKADGYTTVLSRRTGPIAVSPGQPATISFPFPLRPITGAGINQLVCTAFAALAAQGGYAVDGTVALSGPDVQLPYQTCQA